MTANEIRQKFLDFFKSKGHTIVASDSVVPKDDPTVLFTTAGMQQFKRHFLGHIDGYTRAASSQKCLRTDDLDKVGKTPCHHTFFEMLGNFSFGDYFKKDAIAWAWEFLTKEMGLSEDKLWVSVYKDDAEAYNEWVKLGFPKEKIVRLGDKDNFWPAEAKEKGPNGPCGPCSEIFFDYGVNPDCKSKKCDPSCNCGRFTEVWNLVFTQYNRKDGGVLEPLPGKNIDTGMGLERLVAVVQEKKSNYETDLFEPIIKNIKETFPAISETDARIVADHMRAIVFAIGDGVVPSNKGRGFVVKKLITTVSDIFLRHTDDQTYVHKFVSHVVTIMKNVYPNLRNNAEEIEDYVRKTEEDYRSVFITQIPKLKTRIWDIGQTNQSREGKIAELGKLFFFFRDTYGLSISTIEETALSCGVTEKALEEIREGLNRIEPLMEQQKNRSRAGSKMTGDRFANMLFNSALAGTRPTEFVGYDQIKTEARILKLLSTTGEELSRPFQGDEVRIILNKTPFYAESGGQIGDTGYLTGKHGKIRVLDTKKQDDIYLHFGKVEQGELKINETVDAKIDEERRLSIMRNHTATHLLQSALREILGSHVQQQGSLVAEDRLRFDFTHPKALTKEQLTQIEAKIKDHISDNDKVMKEEMSLEEAKKKGALAFFAEKYKDQVRVITIGNYSKEFCGGTHLNSTGEIKQFIISGEGAVAQGIRRLEAKTGSGAQEFIKEREQKGLDRKQSEEKRLQELNEKKTADRQRLESFKDSFKILIEKADSIDDTKVIIYTVKDSDANQLKEFSDLVKQQVPSAIFCSGTSSAGNASIVVYVSADLIKKGIKANELINEIAPLINGSGGGRPELAQAGSKEPAKLNSALQQAASIIKGKLK